MEAAWIGFYEHFSHSIRRIASSCGAGSGFIDDCVQEVWAEPPLRLPTFQPDPARGRFDNWLACVVRSKTIDLLRSQKRRLPQETADVLAAVADAQPTTDQRTEDAELFDLIWQRLEATLSPLNLTILHMRLLEQRPVEEVAETLGVTAEQVWYRYHLRPPASATRGRKRRGEMLAATPRHASDSVKKRN